MTIKLAAKKCKACKGDMLIVKNEELAQLQDQLSKHWKIVQGHHLEREFLFNNFKSALDFTNQVGALSEQEEHHPDIHLSWAKVKILLWTHKVNGLTESDFILAAKIDELI